MKRILFIACKGQGYKDYGSAYEPTGLKNSARFVVDMLKEHRVNAKFVAVVDNNDIDREVWKFLPDVVIIEALWVIPEKFKELARLHPGVQWVVRVHSEIPFLAQEGIAIQWIRDYLALPSVFVAFNSSRALSAFAEIFPSDKYLYLPNYFPSKFPNNSKRLISGVLYIGCFGAIRPLKNQLIQAVAAIRYADLTGKILFFFINSTRVEGGQEILKNLRSLFANSDHFLVEIDWLHHKDFQSMLSGMDISMCVSLSESFCLVAADTVSLGVPLICSPEISWASRLSYAEPNSVDSIVDTMFTVTRLKRFTRFLNRQGLKAYDHESVKLWLEFLQ